MCVTVQTGTTGKEPDIRLIISQCTLTSYGEAAEPMNYWEQIYELGSEHEICSLDESTQNNSYSFIVNL